MNQSNGIKFASLLVFVSFVMMSCAGSPTAQAQITSSGLVCPAPEFPAAIRSKELNIYVWTEYLPAEMLECFESAYGVKINQTEYTSNEEMYAKISTGDTSFDLIQPTDYIVALLVRNHLLQELDHAQLPARQNFDPRYLNLEFDPNNKYTIPYLAGADAIVVNTDRVKTVPQSWADLWKPEYAGRMVFTDDMRTVIGLTLLTLGYDVNSKDPAQLAEAKTKLEELIPNIKLFDSDSPKDALIAGDVDLGLTWTGEALLAKQKNPAIQFIYPAEGAILWQDNWALLAKAPHADLAYAFLNYINQGDLFWLLLRDYPYTNPNKSALAYAQENQKNIYNIYFDSPITNMPFEALRGGHRIADIGGASALYQSVWSDVVGK